MVLVAAVALGSATFAWFVNNNAVTAKDVKLKTTSSVPNLYITSVGQTTDKMTAAASNATGDTLYPVSTPNGRDFYETKHWKTGTGHALADEYQKAQTVETDKNKYADYTFTLGVQNGSMDVYLDSSETATAISTAKELGTAGRMAIQFGEDGEWVLFDLGGTETGKGYYTDSNAASETGEVKYWVADTTQGALAATYADIKDYEGRIDENGLAVKGERSLGTISNSGTVKVTVRFWYEGCDKDCVSENAGNGITDAITGSLGFIGVKA